MKSKLILYTIIATVFSILFGEIILPAMVKHPLPFFTSPIAFLFYYSIISFVFGLIYYYFKFNIKITLCLIFLHGVFIELVVFKNIISISDLVGILFFGSLYVFLFGIPISLTKLLSSNVKR